MFTQSAVLASRAAATHTVPALNTENKEHRSSSSSKPGSSAVPPPTLVLATIGD